MPLPALAKDATTSTNTSIGAIALSAPTNISPNTVTKPASGTQSPRHIPITRPIAILKINGVFV